MAVPLKEMQLLAPALAPDTERLLPPNHCRAPASLATLTEHQALIPLDPGSFRRDGRAQLSNPTKGAAKEHRGNLFRRFRPKEVHDPRRRGGQAVGDGDPLVSQPSTAKVSQPDMPHNAVSGGGYSVLPTDERDSPRQQ